MFIHKRSSLRETCCNRWWLLVAAEQQALDAVKAVLQSRPMLNPPDTSNGYSVQMDISNMGLGTSLVQSTDDESKVVIAWAGKKLTPSHLQHDREGTVRSCLESPVF